jgi:hypothetical protein
MSLVRAQIIRVLIRERYPANYCACLSAERLAAKTQHMTTTEIVQLIDAAHKKIQREPFYSYNSLNNGRCVSNGACMTDVVFDDILRTL